MAEVAAPGKHSPPAYSRWPSPADRPPERTRFHSAVRALSLAHSMMPGLSGTPPSSRGPRELDARAFPGTRESPPISFLSLARSKAASSFPIVSIRTGGRSTSVTIAASRPRLRTSCSPTLKELNCPRSGRDSPPATRRSHTRSEPAPLHSCRPRPARHQHGERRAVWQRRGTFQPLRNRQRAGGCRWPGQQRLVAPHA